MILIPQRLFDSTDVNVILRNGNTCILEKKLSNSILGREGYISNHVISILLSGKQQIKTYEEKLITPQEGHFHSLLFYFGDDVIHEFLSNVSVSMVNKTSVPEYLKLGSVPTIQQFSKSLIEIYQKENLKNKTLLNLKVLELLHLINNLVTEKDFTEFLFQLTLPKKRNIKTFIETNFCKSLTVEDFAYLTGRSVSTFRRDFKNQFDTTPKKWLKEKRIEKAIQLLDTQKLTVTQLAFEVGYENISYFIKEFKGQVGLTPKQYLLHQNRNKLMN